MAVSNFTRFPLGHFPTPFEPLEALSRSLGGPKLFIKRDDCTGLAFGGNKTRKLEYLLADAVAQGSDMLVTAGGIQSNHVRQTAAAARRAGLGCIALLEAPAFTPDPVFYQSGNRLLDEVFNCQCVYLAAGQPDLNAKAQEYCNTLRSQGKAPYFIPVGGSNVVGALGYMSAAEELLQQTEANGQALDRIVLGTGSAGTQAGLVMGLRDAGVHTKVTGIAVSGTASEKISAVHDLCVQIGGYLGGVTAPEINEILVSDEFVGPGYGQPTNKTIEAINLTAQTEGVLLDPVYTGKAMAGLIQMVRSGEISSGENVLFLHTGGAPGLFAYPNFFSDPGGLKAAALNPVSA